MLDRETAAIREYAPPGTRTGDTDLASEPTRAVFLRERQPLTKKVAYRFAGVYRQSAEVGDLAVYERVAESVPILGRHPTPSNRDLLGRQPEEVTE